ncbi:phosphotriesterase-related protein-like [Oncorhynchus tshawytscha]|uniref:phosphotriesterase-related protein-like n=1 Tax=Oncorhynchus tshawytscha TaxID=74940 RepID=UPI001C3E6492|nr:phosphotriesterase-related protein-like [Oncorhynchus tshawytscha]
MDNKVFFFIIFFFSNENLLMLQETSAVREMFRETTFDNGEMLEFAKYAYNLEYNLFGTEMLNYAYNLEVDMPSDSQRVKLVAFLVQEGYEDNIVIAHDIHTKNRLTKYGGQDYSHILKNIVAKMLSRVINQTQVDKALIENSKRWLTFK